MPVPNQIQIGFIKPILDELLLRGVNADYFLSKANLDKISLHSLDSYLPANNVYKFFALLDHRQGLSDIISELNSKLQIMSMGLWGEMASSTPGFLSTMFFTAKFDRVQLTHESISVKISGKTTSYSCCYEDSDLEGKEQVIDMVVAITLNFSKLVGGENWYPLEIHYPGKSLDSLKKILPDLNKTKVFLNQPVFSVVYPTSFLSKPLTNSNHSLNAILNHQSTHHSIHEILCSNDNELMPTIDIISDQMDLPIRSLQRQLAQEGFSFSEIVDQWRMAKAFQLMEEPGLKNREVSALLKYSNHQAFERAFKRWTNTTPAQYREETV